MLRFLKKHRKSPKTPVPPENSTRQTTNVVAKHGSGEGNDVDGKKPDRPDDPPHPPLIVSAGNTDDSAVPDHVREARVLNQNEPDTTSERESDRKSTPPAAAKLLLRRVRDSVVAIGILKSVVGCLCFILENREVRPFSYTLPATLTVTPVKESKRASDRVVGTSD